MDLITWPVVALILGVIGMFVFRTPVAQLIGRTEKIGRDLLHAGPQSQPAAVRDESGSVEEFLRSYDNQLLLEQEAAIRKDIAERGLTEAKDLERLLIRSLAATQILSHFERAYSAIWDSQLALLRRLNTLEEGLAAGEIEAYFAAVLQKHEVLKGHKLPAYLGFLESYNFITQNENRVNITIAGREFLKWLVEAGRPDRGFF
ncbi:MAG: hypothetical protein Q8P50_04075 [Bacillota bacterium]|nr:hypothetical protein [Bacillota bacterium]